MQQRYNRSYDGERRGEADGDRGSGERRCRHAGRGSESFARLKRGWRQLGSLMVAYSGGVDSAFLAATAHRVLGSR